jgi:hypothetical protein
MSPEDRAEAETPAEVDNPESIPPMLRRAKGGRVKFAEGGPVTSASKLDKIARALMQGASFNFSDEAIAALDDEPYDEAIARERGILEEFSYDDPLQSLGSEVAGALPAAIGTGALIYKNRGKMASRTRAGKALGMLQAARRVLPKSATGRSALVGATAGGVAGLGASQRDNAPISTTSGAMVGALAGPLGGVIAKYGVKTGTKIMDFFSGRSISAADRKIVEAVIRDDGDLTKLAAEVIKDNRRGIPSTLADVGGPNVQGLAENVSRRVTPGSDEALANLERRQMGTHERVTDQTNTALKPDDFFGKQEELKEHLYNDAKPLYQQAYAENPAISTRSFGIIADTEPGRRAIKEAIEAAHTTARIDGIPIEQSIGKFNPVTGMVEKPSLQFLDQLKRSLDSMINVEERNGATGPGRDLRRLRGLLMRDLDDPAVVSDTYRKARQQYAGDLEVLDALNVGRNDFSRMSVKELREATKNMSWAEKDALRTGVAEALFQRVDTTSATSNPARRVIGTPGMVEKLKSLFDSEADFNKFYSALVKEGQMFDRGAKTIRGARSARVGAAGEHGSAARDLLVSGGAALVGAGDAFANQAPGMWRRAGNLASRAMNPMSEETVDSISRTLNTNDPLALGVPIQTLQQKLEQLSKRLHGQNRRTLEGAFVTGTSLNPDPYGYIGAEEEPGYASGGPVGWGGPSTAGILPGEHDWMEQLPAPVSQIRIPTPVPRGSAMPSLSSVPGTTYGTGATRSRAPTTGIDYEHYGEGPEQQFFTGNRAPDAQYTTTPVAVPGSGMPSASKSSSGVGAALGLLAGAKDIGKIYETVTGKSALTGLKGLAGKLGIGAGAGAGSGAAVGTTLAAPLADMGAYTTAAMGAATDAAGAGVTSALGGGSGLGGIGSSLSTLGSNIYGGLAAMGPVGWAGAAALAAGTAIAASQPKSSPLNHFKYDKATGTGGWTKGERFDGMKFAPDELNSFYGPAMNDFIKSGGDFNAAMALLPQPKNEREATMYKKAKHLFGGSGNPMRKVAMAKDYGKGEWSKGYKGKKDIAKAYESYGNA